MRLTGRTDMNPNTFCGNGSMTFGRNLPFICEYLYRAFVHKQKGLTAQNIHHLDDGPMTFANSQRATRSAKVVPMARSFRAVTCLFLLGLVSAVARNAAGFGIRRRRAAAPTRRDDTLRNRSSHGQWPACRPRIVVGSIKFARSNGLWCSRIID